jgi:hypothetical protein
MIRKADSNLYWSAAWLSAKARRRKRALRQPYGRCGSFRFSKVKAKLLLLICIAEANRFDRILISVLVVADASTLSFADASRGIIAPVP